MFPNAPSDTHPLSIFGINVPMYTAWADPMWASNQGKGVTPTIKIYHCPADPTLLECISCNHLSYAVNEAVFRGSTQWGVAASYPANITDGTSNTVFYVEKEFYCYGISSPESPWNEIRDANNYVNCIDCRGFPVGPAAYPQFQPKAGACNPGLPSTFHDSVMNVGMGDGSVRSVAQGISPLTWSAVLSPSAGDLPGSDW